MGKLSIAEFSKLPSKQRRTLIAKDIIKRINDTQYIASTGRYLNRYDFDAIEGTAQVCNIIKKRKVICTVCARGALFLSSVVFRNAFKVASTNDLDFAYDGKSTKSIGKDFPIKMQAMIETFFEGTTYGNLDYNIVRDILRYRLETHKNLYNERSYVNIDTYLLLEICNNIIRNKGDFKIP
jgi:hypothetical protein